MGDIFFVAWDTKYGQIDVNIRGQRYVYRADPTFIPGWIRQAKYRPGRVLNDIKRHVDLGAATLLSKPLKFKEWFLSISER